MSQTEQTQQTHQTTAVDEGLVARIDRVVNDLSVVHKEIQALPASLQIVANRLLEQAMEQRRKEKQESATDRLLESLGKLSDDLTGKSPAQKKHEAVAQAEALIDKFRKLLVSLPREQYGKNVEHICDLVVEYVQARHAAEEQGLGPAVKVHERLTQAVALSRALCGRPTKAEFAEIMRLPTVSPDLVLVNVQDFGLQNILAAARADVRETLLAPLRVFAADVPGDIYEAPSYQAFDISEEALPFVLMAIKHFPEHYDPRRDFRPTNRKAATVIALLVEQSNETVRTLQDAEFRKTASVERLMAKGITLLRSVLDGKGYVTN